MFLLSDFSLKKVRENAISGLLSSPRLFFQRLVAEIFLFRTPPSLIKTMLLLFVYVFVCVCVRTRGRVCMCAHACMRVLVVGCGWVGACAKPLPWSRGWRRWSPRRAASRISSSPAPPTPAASRTSSWTRLTKCWRWASAQAEGPAGPGRRGGDSLGTLGTAVKQVMLVTHDMQSSTACQRWGNPRSPSPACGRPTVAAICADLRPDRQTLMFTATWGRAAARATPQPPVPRRHRCPGFPQGVAERRFFGARCRAVV